MTSGPVVDSGYPRTLEQALADASTLGRTDPGLLV